MNHRSKLPRIILIPVKLRAPSAANRKRQIEKTTKNPKATHESPRPYCCTSNV